MSALSTSFTVHMVHTTYIYVKHPLTYYKHSVRIPYTPHTHTHTRTHTHMHTNTDTHTNYFSGVRSANSSYSVWFSHCFSRQEMLTLGNIIILQNLIQLVTEHSMELWNTISTWQIKSSVLHHKQPCHHRHLAYWSSLVGWKLLTI